MFKFCITSEFDDFFLEPTSPTCQLGAKYWQSKITRQITFRPVEYNFLCAISRVFLAPDFDFCLQSKRAGPAWPAWAPGPQSNWKLRDCAGKSKCTQVPDRYPELHKRYPYWADDKQSKARNSDSKYRQMALVGLDTLIMFYKQHCKKEISLSFSKFHSRCLICL